MASSNPYTSPFVNSSGKNPYATNPFAKNPFDTKPVNNDMDEDDDLKMNTRKEEKPEPLTERQKKFAKFKKLQSDTVEKGRFVKVGDKKKKKKQKKQNKSKRNKSSKQRANSLPRNVNDNDKKDKDDYIFFHPQQQQQQKQKQEAIIPIEINKEKPNQFDALNLETSLESKKFDATSKKKNKFGKLMGPSIEIHTASYRSIRVPGHRMIHVRRMWKDICEPIIKQLKLQIRMNSKKNLIELRMIEDIEIDNSALMKGKKNKIQKGSDFIRGAVIGFEIRDCLALIRMDDIYLETFDIRDVKFFNKKSDHWMRAIGRIAGQYGKIKYSIENSTNTRIVIFGFKVHILGSFSSIRLARNSISRLIMGSAPGNVYAKLRVVSNKLKHKF